MRSDIDPVIGARSGANGDQSSMGSGTAAKAREGAEQLKNKALERVEDVRQQAYSQRDRVADRVRRVSSAVRSAGDRLRDEDEFVARYVDMAGERIDRAADYLSTVEPQQVVRDVENFARRQPAVFFGGAFLLGLAAARFFKSSQSYDEVDQMDMSREFFEDDQRFARAYSSSSEVSPSPSAWETPPSESVGQGTIPASPTIDVGTGYTGSGQDWPERKG